MKKDLKKILAISILSVGFLSSISPAFCAPHSDKDNDKKPAPHKIDRPAIVIPQRRRQQNDILNVQAQRRTLDAYTAMMPFFYLNTKQDIVNFFLVSKKFGGNSGKFKVNPKKFSSFKDIKKLLPGIETFVDSHQMTIDENRSTHINELDNPDKGNLKTLVYYSGSFDAFRYNEILKINGISEDLMDAKVVDFSDSKGLYGNVWQCKVFPFNGMNCRVEYTKNYKELIENKRNQNLESVRRIVFIFNPMEMVKNTIDRLLSSKKITQEDVKSGRFELVYQIFNLYNSLLSDYNINCRARNCLTVDFNTIKRFIVPSYIVNIDNWFMSGFGSLQEIVIPSTVKTIGDFAFRDCISLREVNIHSGVSEIKNAAFMVCMSLKKIDIPDTVKTLGSGVFSGCISLEEVKIPNGITEIKHGTFSYCTSLTRIKIPDSVKSIGDDAFEGCRLLREINIPDGIAFVHPNAFNKCCSLKNINYKNKTYSVQDFFENFNK